ncbi:hypothetical protein [Streptomyces sp. NPDC020983]|uniref:hypothetical protein n=1 Tax=Streptomyces sp. NPDC020983 TaxID=3365106 RepID=UPI0037B0406B
MNVRRFLSKAAAGSVLLAAATSATAATSASAQAPDLGSTLSGTAVTAQTVGEQAAGGLVAQSGVAKKVGAVKKAVQAGTDAVNAGNELVN